MEIVCEAETGIGKTLGYLLPATIYALKRKNQSLLVHIQLI